MPFHDLTLMMRWQGKSRLGRGKDSYGQMDGVLKIYNIGQVRGAYAAHTRLAARCPLGGAYAAVGPLACHRLAG